MIIKKTCSPTELDTDVHKSQYIHLLMHFAENFSYCSLQAASVFSSVPDL